MQIRYTLMRQMGYVHAIHMGNDHAGDAIAMVMPVVWVPIDVWWEPFWCWRHDRAAREGSVAEAQRNVSVVKEWKNITVKDRFIHSLMFVSCCICWKCQYWKICKTKLCHGCFKVTFKKAYHYGPIQIRRHIPNSKPSSHKFQTEEILYDIAKGY